MENYLAPTLVGAWDATADIAIPTPLIVEDNYCQTTHRYEDSKDSTTIDNETKKVVIYESSMDFGFNMEMWEMYLKLKNESSMDLKYKLLIHDYENNKIFFDSYFIKYLQDIDYLQIFLVLDGTTDSAELREFLLHDIPENFISIYDITDNRECKMLIEVIENCDLGKHNNYKIVEVPKDLKYHIGNYSDESYVEVIVENHRTYSSNGLKWVGTTT